LPCRIACEVPLGDGSDGTFNPDDWMSPKEARKVDTFILYAMAAARQAVGDSGVYDVSQQTIRLTGNVVLTKDANVMRGNALEVSMATGLARLTADAASAAPGQPPGRVQGLFVPAPAAGKAPPQPPANPGNK
jgi:lipopolysaccharide export system protein LptA